MSSASYLFAPFQANVYLYSTFAGSLYRDENENYTFEYSPDYIKLNLPPISVAFPVKEHKYTSKGCLHPFFDNLVSEGLFFFYSIGSFLTQFFKIFFIIQFILSLSIEFEVNNVQIHFIYTEITCL